MLEIPHDNIQDEKCASVRVSLLLAIKVNTSSKLLSCD